MSGSTILAFMLGPFELTIIGIIAVLLFGSQLPKLARNLGSGMVEFKKGLKYGTDDIDEVRRELHDATNDLNKEIRDAGK
jgi:TatA/E family protein of Tat protein translocase